MKTRTAVARTSIAGLICLALLLAVCGGQPAWADSNISSTNKYAWSENAGWTNFYADLTNGVVVGDKILTGYAWQENVGWINMGSGNPDPGTGYYLNTTASNWGVNHVSATGALSGYAWGENVGWINFAPDYGGVWIVTGDLPRSFSGWAWGENIGWIQFSDVNVPNNVQQAGPTLVDLVSFAARPCVIRDCVLIEWKTASEIDNAGFHLWRTDTEDGEYVKVTGEIIPAEGDAAQGASYLYEDAGIDPGAVYFYKLEAVDMDGKSDFYGPVVVETRAGPPEPWGPGQADAATPAPGNTTASRSIGILLILIAPALAVAVFRRRRRAAP